MSLFLHNGDRFLSFKEFITEAFFLKEVQYGTNTPNFDNGEINTTPNDDYWTIAKVKDDVYVMLVLRAFNGYEFGFGVSRKPSLEFDDYSDDRTDSHVALRVFNSIFYVLLEMLDDKNVKDIVFNPADEKLGKFYDKMVHNKSFVKLLNDNGFEQSVNNKYRFYKG